MRGAPLRYVIRKNAVVEGDLPALAENQPCTKINGSVRADMVVCYTHDHPLYREDSSMLFEILDKIFQNTPFYLSLKLYQDQRDGRNAYLTIISHYAGEDKWEKELKKNKDFLQGMSMDRTVQLPVGEVRWAASQCLPCDCVVQQACELPVTERGNSSSKFTRSDSKR